MDDRHKDAAIQAWMSGAMDAAGQDFMRITAMADDKCESEIEKVLFTVFVMSLLGAEVFTYTPVVFVSADKPIEQIPLPDDATEAVYITPQYKVDKYRADFAIRMAGFHNGPRGNPLISSRVFLIECDGHEFHERTADQATRDKGRDRLLQANGYSVLRFTGREIWRCPTTCVNEILETLRASHEEAAQSFHTQVA